MSLNNGERGDLAHLALFLWASGASALLVFTVRELTASMRRFDDFVRELARGRSPLCVQALRVARAQLMRVRRGERHGR